MPNFGQSNFGHKLVDSAHIIGKALIAQLLQKFHEIATLMHVLPINDSNLQILGASPYLEL